MSTTTTSCYLSQPLFHLLIFWGVGFELLYCGFLRTLMLPQSISAPKFGFSHSTGNFQWTEVCVRISFLKCLCEKKRWFLWVLPDCIRNTDDRGKNLNYWGSGFQASPNSRATWWQNSEQFAYKMMNVISEGPRVHGTADNRRGITNIPWTERKSWTNKQPQEAKGGKGRTKMAASASLSLYTQRTTGYLQRITLVCIQELSSAMLFQSLADRIEASIHEFFLGQISSSRLLFQPSRFFLACRKCSLPYLSLLQ